MSDKKLYDAFQHWQELSLSDSEYFAYLDRLKRIKDEESIIIEAKLREEEARQKALAEGIEQGLAEGREQGRKEGHEQVIRQMIINLIKNEFSDEMIAKVTNQSIEKVQVIRESM